MLSRICDMSSCYVTWSTGKYGLRKAYATWTQKPSTFIHRRTQDFTMEGVHVVGPGLGDGSPPVGSRSKAPVEGLGDFVPQKLKQNVKLASNF